MGCADRDRRWRHGDGMRQPREAMVARRGNAPAKKSGGGTARGCAGEKMGNGGAARGCASQMEQHQIGGLAANAPANEETEIGGECAGQVKQRQIDDGSAGNAPAKWNNTKSVAARRGMRWPNRTTPNWWIGGKCAGETEQHQIGGSAANTPAKRNNTKLVDRRRMRRQTKENAARR